MNNVIEFILCLYIGRLLLLVQCNVLVKWRSHFHRMILNHLRIRQPTKKTLELLFQRCPQKELLSNSRQRGSVDQSEDMISSSNSTQRHRSGNFHQDLQSHASTPDRKGLLENRSQVLLLPFWLTTLLECYQV